MKNIMCSCGIRMDEAVENFSEIFSQLPPIGEDDMQMIMQNPMLDAKQKMNIIELIRSDIVKGGSGE